MTWSRNKSAAVALAIALAAPAEGLRQYVYKCPAGIATVCFGHTGNVQQGRKYSLDECKSLLTSDMLEAINIVERCHPGLPDEILAAFGDAVFNIGPKVACNSTASNYLASRNYMAACNELPKWNKANGMPLPGLTKRRAQERELCLQGVAHA